MKKSTVIILFLAILGCYNPVKAQLNNIGAGFVLSPGGKLNFEGYRYYNNSFGFDLRTYYDLNKKFRLVPNFKFYLPNKEDYTLGGFSKTTTFVLNVDIHYILNPRENFQFYFLGGVGESLWKIIDKRVTSISGAENVDAYKFVIGANIGSGLKFHISSHRFLFADLKYVISKANQLVFNPGIVFEF